MVLKAAFYARVSTAEAKDLQDPESQLIKLAICPFPRIRDLQEVHRIRLRLRRRSAEIEKGHSVVGLEIDEASAINARMNGCDVIIGDAENFSQLGFENESFDAILCLDVLEHTKDPKRVLESIKPAMKSDGIIVCSIPNVANIRIRMEIVIGRWNYTETGILDRTHLRFFSVSSARTLVGSAGYRIISEEYSPGIPLMNNTNFTHRITNMFPGLFATQTIIIASKKPSHNNLNHL